MSTESSEQGVVVAPRTLFLIGLSGGAIAAVFPRFITYLSNPNVNTVVLSFDFMYVALVFGIVVGISMYWLYLGTAETTKTLFMASLALPSILSGGINMANSTSAGQSQIESLASEKAMLEKQLQDFMEIPTVTELQFDDGQGANLSDDFLPTILGISTAHAAGSVIAESGADDEGFNPGVQFKQSKKQSGNYVIMLDSSTDKAKLDEKMKLYQGEFNIQNLVIKQSKGMYYIIQQDERTKTDALLDAAEIKNKYQIEPKLIRVK